MPSLFRIDKHSLTATSPSSVVKLPGFDDLVEREPEPEGEEERVVPEVEEDKEQQQIELKRQQLRELEIKITQARQEAEAIIAAANGEAERLAAQASARGYEEGMARAGEEALKEKEEANNRVESVVAALKKARDNVFSQVEGSVHDLALYLAEHIMKLELNRNDEAFLNIVRDTLSKVKYQSNIIVKVSKTEYERIFENHASGITRELKNSGVEIKQDLSLKSGECIVETEYGTINSGIKTQLKRIGYALEESITE